MTADPLAPGSTIGILGGGQLGRMLAQAAAKLGLKASIFAPDEDSPAFDVAAHRHRAGYDDRGALLAFAREADAVTYEFENVPASALLLIGEHSRLYPPPRALAVAQDRLEERRFLRELDLPCAPHTEIHSKHDLQDGYRALVTGAAPGSVAFLKRARYGYDGKGQIRLRSEDDLAGAKDWLGGDAALLEMGVEFQFEFSILGVRNSDGDVRFYDAPQNIHGNGILRESIVPAPISGPALETARNYVERIAAALDYVGLIAVEMFAEGENDSFRPLINEIAPRVHNSGHWTVEACTISQFENHIRAIAGWPVGSTERHSDARMVNLLGPEVDDWETLLSGANSRSLTLYGKKDASAGRKMGHYVERTAKLP